MDEAPRDRGRTTHQPVRDLREPKARMSVLLDGRPPVGRRPARRARLARRIEENASHPSEMKPCVSSLILSVFLELPCDRKCICGLHLRGPVFRHAPRSDRSRHLWSPHVVCSISVRCKSCGASGLLTESLRARTADSEVFSSLFRIRRISVRLFVFLSSMIRES